MARTPKAREPEEMPKLPPLLMSQDPVEELEADEIEALAQEEEFDIFVDVGDKLTKAGDRITYTIKRDGEFIAGSIRHPYSWDQLQKQYGAGTYQVTARSMKKGGYVKSQSRNVAALMSTDEEEGEERNDSNSTSNLLMLLQAQKREEREELQRLEEKRERERQEREERIERDRLEREEKADRDRREREESLKRANSDTMMLMMKMMEQSSSQTTALMTAMFQGNQRREPELNVEKIMQMMDSRMEKVIGLLQGKDKTKDIDALKLIELQSSAEDKGYRKALDLQRMAEERAEELMERRESANAPPEKESTTKMLLESVVPAMQTLLSARGGIPAVMPPTVPAAIPIASHSQSVPVRRPPPATVNPHLPAQPPKPRSHVPLHSGLPRATPAVARPVAPKEEPMTLNQKIEQIVVTEIGKDLGKNMLTPSKMNPEGVAEKVLELLHPLGVKPDSLCSSYSVDDMMRIAKAKGMPDAIKPYIERFHAAIKAKTAVGPGPTAQGSQPGNS